MHFQKPMLGTPLDWEHPFNKDLALHLAMNEGHGDVVRDLSMNGNHGSLGSFAFPSTVASGWNPGRTGVGLNFDGTSDYVDCGNDASLNFTDTITISTWINKGGNVDVWNRIVTSAGVNPRYLMNIDSDNKFRWYMNDNVGNSVDVDSGLYTITLDTWYHFVVVFGIDNIGRLYVNGVEKGTGAVIDLQPFAVNVLNIGKYSDIDHFNGSIDQVRIHSRALTAKEVKDYYINPWQVYLDEEGN